MTNARNLRDQKAEVKTGRRQFWGRRLLLRGKLSFTERNRYLRKLNSTNQYFDVFILSPHSSRQFLCT